MDRPEEIVDNPDAWVAEHIREYVRSGKLRRTPVVILERADVPMPR